MNYYELFNLPITAVVNKVAISKKYIELQKKYHPDFYTNENENDKENALEHSAAINKAYNIFNNKENTIEYFLQVNGIIVAEEKYILPADFLMEMMELNEGFDEDVDIAEKVKAYEKKLQVEIEPLLSTENIVQFNESNLEKLKLYYYKKKYLKRILERLDD